MPHITSEYTPNLADELDLARLVRELHDAARALGEFPAWGIRSLAVPATAALVAGDPDHGYVQVRVRIAPGRPEEVRARIATTLFKTLQTVLAPVTARRVVGFQLEVSEFDAAVTRTGGTIPGSPTNSAGLTYCE